MFHSTDSSKDMPKCCALTGLWRVVGWPNARHHVSVEQGKLHVPTFTGKYCIHELPLGCIRRHSFQRPSQMFFYNLIFFSVTHNIDSKGEVSFCMEGCTLQQPHIGYFGTQLPPWWGCESWKSCTSGLPHPLGSLQKCLLASGQYMCFHCWLFSLHSCMCSD